MTTAAERELATWTLAQVERFRPRNARERIVRALNIDQLRRYLQAVPASSMATSRWSRSTVHI